jgi:acetyl-CoA decarbonylase/synthase complex subunit gamma
MHYKITPGLYALGTPDPESIVLVTGNYKMSFDRLRSALSGFSVWILSLDTKGINVWCAAGKGTFGTDELVNRIRDVRLDQVVNHRRLILPQLGAPGVAAHQVKKESGFSVTYGPIKASDIPKFIKAGCKADPSMRKKSFGIGERLILIPIELVTAFKWFILITAAFLFLEGISGPHDFWSNTAENALFTVLALSGALCAGTILTPIFLPWIPGRAFSFKGGIAGFFILPLLWIIRKPETGSWPVILEMAAWLFMIPSISAFLGMNFTGASTYTSLSGVKKEMKWALPFEISGTGIGFILWMSSKWIW